MLFTTKVTYAVPANPFPQTVTQADGSEVTLVIRGDEFFNWVETLDGSVVAFDNDTNNWHYAYITEDGLVSPGIEIAGGISRIRRTKLTSEDLIPLIEGAERNSSREMLISPTGIESHFDTAQASVLPRISHYQNRQPLLVLLIEYNNRTLSTTPAHWSNLFFGTSGVTVNTYFREISNDFDLQFHPPQFTVSDGFIVPTTSLPAGVSSAQIVNRIARVRLNRNHPNPSNSGWGGPVHQDIDLACPSQQPAQNRLAFL